MRGASLGVEIRKKNEEQQQKGEIEKEGHLRTGPVMGGVG